MTIYSLHRVYVSIDKLTKSAVKYTIFTRFLCVFASTYFAIIYALIKIRRRRRQRKLVSCTSVTCDTVRNAV